MVGERRGSVRCHIEFAIGAVNLNSVYIWMNIIIFVAVLSNDGNW